MRFFSSVRFLLLAMGLFTLAGCVLSDNPVTDVSTAQPDPNLVGIWTRMDDGKAQIMIVGNWNKKDAPAALMAFNECGLDKDGNLDTAGDPTVFFASTLPGGKYINILQGDYSKLLKDGTWAPDGVTGYEIQKYQINGDKLQIWSGDEVVAAHAIDKGAIKGEVSRPDKPDPNNPDAGLSGRFKDTSANVAAFLSGPGAAGMFPDSNKTTYTRVKVMP